MWAAVVFFLLSSLSLSENQTPSLTKSEARVLQVLPLLSKERCVQECKDRAPPGGPSAGHLFCRLSTKDPEGCILLNCTQISMCQNATAQDIQELASEYASHVEKQNNVTPTATEPGTPAAPPSTKTISLSTSHPATVTSGNRTELGAQTPEGSAAPDVSSQLGPSPTAMPSIPSAAMTPQVQRANGTITAVMTAKTALAPSTQASTALPSTQASAAPPRTSQPLTQNQTNVPDSSGSPAAGANVTRSKATGGHPNSPTTQTLPMLSRTSSTTSSPTYAEGGSVETLSSPVVFSSSESSADSFSGTPAISTSTRAEPPTQTEPAPSTPQATDTKAMPTTMPTTVTQAAGPVTSQTAERTLHQATLSPLSPKVTTESSPTMPEASIQTGTDSPYVWIATSPFTQYLVNKNLLLAMLLAGAILVIAILVLLAMQAYESYKKKDYTQVDYLINGMYADSEI